MLKFHKSSFIDCEFMVESTKRGYYFLLRRSFIIKDNRLIRKEIYLLILPIILENIFQVSASLITVGMIGRLSPLEISAQGICMRISESLNVLFRGVAIGSTVYISRAFGENNRNKCFTVFHQAIITAVPLALLFGVVIFSTPLTFLSFLSDNNELLGISSTYMRINICGLPFVSIMALVTSAFQGHSNTKTPMKIAILVNISNIILGYILIFGVGGIGGIGINGAAIALTLSQALGAFVGLFLLFKGKNKVFSLEQFKGNLFHYRLDYIKDIYSTGIPAAIENFLWQFSAIIMSKAILSYGEVYFSAYQIGIQAETITEMPAIGFSVAATSLSAKAIGMRDEQLFKSYFKEQVRLCAILSIFTSLSLLLLPKVFMSVMTPNPEIQAIGTVYVFVMGFVQFPQNVSRILSGTLRSAGYKNVPMIIAFVGIWLFRIPMALLITYVLKADILFIWLCIAADQFIRIIASTLIFKKHDVLNTALQTAPPTASL